jgi:hypothetical protein
VSVYKEYTVISKQFIRDARAAGFRGSIREMLGIDTSCARAGDCPSCPE